MVEWQDSDIEDIDAFEKKLMDRLPEGTKHFGGERSSARVEDGSFVPVRWRWVMIQFPERVNIRRAENVFTLKTLDLGSADGVMPMVTVPTDGQYVVDFLNAGMKKHMGEWCGKTLGRQFEVAYEEEGVEGDGLFAEVAHTKRWEHSLVSN